jgi:hypothetical protein
MGRNGHARWSSDALGGSAVGAGRWQDAAGEHRWGPGVAPGRRRGGGAHPSGGSTCGGGVGCRCRGGGQRQGRRGVGEQWGGGQEAGKGAAGAMSKRRGGITARGRELGRRRRCSPFFKGGGGDTTGGRLHGGGAGESEGGPGAAEERLGSRQRDGAADRWARTIQGPVVNGVVRGEAVWRGAERTGSSCQWEQEGKWAARGSAGGGKGMRRARKHSSI